MSRLPDVRREVILWEIAKGHGIRTASKVTGHKVTTVASLVLAFQSVVERAGFRLREGFRKMDQFQTITRLGQPGRLLTPIVQATPASVLWTRAALAQAHHDERTQALFAASLPLIRMYYAPCGRAEILEAEAREQGAFAPADCRHCGGAYGWKRHEEICVRFGLSG